MLERLETSRSRSTGIGRPSFTILGQARSDGRPVRRSYYAASIGDDSCYACGGPTLYRQVGIASVAVCQSCGFGQVPDELRPADYWDRSDDVVALLDADYWSGRQVLFKRALSQMAKRSAPGRVADLGGGVGYFAACAIDMGWDAYSIDVSELAVEAATARVGESRSLLGIPEFLVGTCDVVTLWCVVAHVPDPRAVIVDALRLLKKGGRLLLSTPNFLFQARYAALAAKIRRPIDFVAADHFMHFTPAAIDRVLADAGAKRLAFAHWGITPECVLAQRLAGVLVPCKRIWNRVAFSLAQVGVPPYYSELHVEATHAGSAREV